MIKSSAFLPYGRQSVSEDDIAAVAEVLRGEYLTTGPTVSAFERSFAEAVGAEHAIACANGTAALHLAAMALGLGSGDHVVVPAMTFVATANAARYVGAEVTFADVDPETGLLTSETFLQALGALERSGARAKAVIPVHLNGQCCDMPAIADIARARDIRIVEDAAHAVGSIGPDSSTIGDTRWSDIATFSFHPVKTIACGEGGMITTANATLAGQVRKFCSHGLVRDPLQFKSPPDPLAATPAPWYYEMPEPGYNYRLSDIHAALGRSQLRRLDHFVEERRRLAELYDKELSRLSNRLRPIARMPNQLPAWHLYPVLCDFNAIGRSRTEIILALKERGIGTQVHYIPVSRQPYYVNRYGAHDLPGADAYYQRALSLPLYPEMTDDDVLRVVDALDATTAPSGDR